VNIVVHPSLSAMFLVIISEENVNDIINNSETTAI